MVYLAALWLPILLAAVAVFVASSILHMVVGHHRSDYKAMPGEGAVLAAMRENGVSPGYYSMPHCTDMKELQEPEVQEKFKKGPVALVTVMPSGVPSMGKSLALWFVFCLVISVIVAYLTGRTLGPGTEYLEVFRVAGTAALLGYVGAEVTQSIWRGLPWSITLKNLLDGLVYSLVTAGVFGWLWPS